jgi:hypothetical protein
VSFVRNLALWDVTAVDLDAMLAENETLFVEHKGSIGDGAFQVAKAMCSFVNTLGGWVLIGVTNGAPNAGLPDGWEPLAAADLTDRVRGACQTPSMSSSRPRSSGRRRQSAAVCAPRRSLRHAQL